MSERTRDIETLFRPGGLVPVDVETTAGLIREVLRLREALEEIAAIVHTPTKETRHKGALDHFPADFDAIRKIARAALLPVMGAKE